jgi:energy-coupling factor transporter ATP-binding protein EcfA2
MVKGVRMEPLTLTLLGYPLSILASITYNQLKNLSKKTEIVPLKDLFLKAFFTSLKYHDEHYDDYAKKIVKKLRKAVKKDEGKLLIIISQHSSDFNNFLSSVKNRTFQQSVAEEIIKEFSLDLENSSAVMNSIIIDCLNYYQYAFFNKMTEKEGIQTILIKCLKLDSILDLLKQIDSKVATKRDFDELRSIVLLNYLNENKEARKKLRDYDCYLQNKFKYLELRGFSPKVSGKEVQMRLLDVFVPLEINIDKSIVPNIQDEKIPILQRTIGPKDSNDKENKKEDLTASVLKHGSLVILGDPGSGKSTLMKYLTVKVTQLRNSDHLYANIIPICIRISDYADYFKKTKKTLYEFITDHSDKQYQHIFKEGFEYSNILLLMDGLDEITDTPLRIRLNEQVMDLMARYPYNHYVVTSRIVGYQESKLGGDFKHFKLMPFGKDEIKLFSVQWYESIAKHTDKDYDHAREQADNLSSSITRSPSVVRLATNPLLMTIIAMIHYKGKKLPNKRVELYDVSTETFLEYWVQLRMEDESQLKDKNEIIEILAPIAFEIHKNKSNALIEEKEFEESFLSCFKGIHTNTSNDDAKKECREFINFLRQQAGFFYEKGEDDEGNRFYGFIHLTFEEYLAAIELVSRWNEGELYLKDYVFSPRWSEVLRLAAAQLLLSNKGRIGRKQTTQFVRDILSVDDQFPEAHRPLQLVCLILSDDVNIMDDLLNEILNKIIEIASKLDFEDIIESFSKLFREMLFSDYGNIFLERFEKKIVATDDPTLLNNLMFILVANSWNKTVNEILIKVHNKSKKIHEAIYKVNYRNFPFQNSEAYKETLIKYLSYLKAQNDKEGLRNSLYTLLCSITKSSFPSPGTGKNIQRITSMLNQHRNTIVFDDIMRTFLKYSLFDYLHGRHRNILNLLLKSHPKNVLVKNLDKSLKGGNIKQYKLAVHGYSYSSFFEIRNYDVLLKKGDSLQLCFWSRSFDKLFSNTVLFTDISSYLKNLKSMFCESDIEIIENKIYFILSPQKDAKTENTTRFIKANESGELYNFFDWEGFPLANITSNPPLLSKIIVQHGQVYIHSRRRTGEKINELINLKDYNNEGICPPAKLLAYHLLNQQFDPKLMEESIVYFRSCSDKEKKGAFSILYNILNPFELA